MRHVFQARYPAESGKLKILHRRTCATSTPCAMRCTWCGLHFPCRARSSRCPLVSFFPIEAVKTNVLGTENVLNAAIDAGVQKHHLPVHRQSGVPRQCDGYLQSHDGKRSSLQKSRTVSPEKTKICCTRYGNVLCSRGSVIPLCDRPDQSRRTSDRNGVPI